MRKASFVRNKRITMQWLGFEANLNSSFLISHHFATKWYLHGTSQMLKRNRELEESRARGIRPLHRCWRGQRWVGEWTCTGGLLIYYAMRSCNYCTYHVYSLHVLILPFESQSLYMCTHATRILAVASIWEWRLFRSARPEVWRQFESSG